MRQDPSPRDHGEWHDQGRWAGISQPAPARPRPDRRAGSLCLPLTFWLSPSLCVSLPLRPATLSEIVSHWVSLWGCISLQFRLSLSLYMSLCLSLVSVSLSGLCLPVCLSLPVSVTVSSCGSLSLPQCLSLSLLLPSSVSLLSDSMDCLPGAVSPFFLSSTFSCSCLPAPTSEFPTTHPGKSTSHLPSPLCSSYPTP